MDSSTITKTTTIRSNTTSSGGKLTGVGGVWSGGAGDAISGSNAISSRYITPVANARTLVINRTAPGVHMGGNGGSSRTITTTYESARHVGGLSSAPGVASKVLHSDVGAIKSGRAKEKQELRDLNERFANYIEKVRFLEAQNKKLANELANLRDKWGKDTEKVKEMYTVEMEQLRKLLNDAEKSRGDLEVRLHSLEDLAHELQFQLDRANETHNVDRETIDKLNHQLSDCDGELSLLRRRVTGLEEERTRDKAEIQRLRDEIKRLRMDLDQETLNHINAEHEAQSLRDELEFIKKVHESELKELAALAYRDTTQENREFWKNEMSQALREIQNDYDNKMDIMRNDMESHYNIKIQEIRTSGTRDNLELNNIKEENVRIKSQMSDMRNRLPELEARNAQLDHLLSELRRELSEKDREYELDRNGLRNQLMENRSELEAVLAEMQHLSDAKLSLELEIAAYRKLLESEESRLGLHDMMDTFMVGGAGGGGAGMTDTFMVGGAGGGGAGMTGKSMSMAVSGSGGSAGGAFGSSMEQQIMRNEASKVSSSLHRSSGEMSAKTTYQRTAKGNVTIQDVSPDGKFITLENISTKREDVSGMQIRRNVDNGKITIQYTIPKNTFLEPQGQDKILKIWARGQKPSGSYDLEIIESNWGVGGDIVTTLISTDGEEKATHTQKTIFNR